MKIEKVILKRDAICRWDCHRWADGHDIKKGTEAIKIYDFNINGKLPNIFICKEHAKEMQIKLYNLLQEETDPCKPEDWLGD